MLQAQTIRAVAFDLDGTLIDTMPDLVAATNSMLRILGTRELPEAKVKELVGDGVERLVHRAVTASIGGSPSENADLATIPCGGGETPLVVFRRVYSQELFKRSRVYPGVMPTLHALRRSGKRLCCITNKNSLFALPLLEAARLSEWLAFTLCADREEDRKPNPAMLLEACSRLAVAPAEMMYVGDSYVDIQAARAAGCGIVAVSYGYGKPRRPDDLAPDALIDTFTALPLGVT
jgi:phosphoglycolate phosphatase